MIAGGAGLAALAGGGGGSSSTIAVTPITPTTNHAPVALATDKHELIGVGATGTEMIKNGVTYHFKSSDFPYTDADGDAIQYIVITNISEMTTLTFNGVVVQEGQKIPFSQIDKLMFQAITAYISGVASPYSFDYTLQDAASGVSDYQTFSAYLMAPAEAIDPSSIKDSIVLTSALPVAVLPATVGSPTSSTVNLSNNAVTNANPDYAKQWGLQEMGRIGYAYGDGKQDALSKGIEAIWSSGFTARRDGCLQI